MLKKIETVLIGTSLTEASEEVVRTGLKVARAAQARVALVHAYAPRVTYGGAPFVPELPMEGVTEAEKESLRRQMESQAERLGIKPEELAGFELGLAPAHQMITETARQINAGLIVVGAAESPRLAKLFGSTADRVVRKATCPVLVVRRDLQIPPARVLLPVDLSYLSAEAFHEGLEVLGLLSREPLSSLSPGTGERAGERGNGINLEAMYVVTDLDRHLFASEEAPEGAEAHAREELERFLVRHVAGSPFAVAPRVVSGDVEDEILLRLREWEPSLMVIGTHGRSGFERFLLGSVAGRVIRDGGTNVLVVPPAVAREQSEAVREALQEVKVG